MGKPRKEHNCVICGSPCKGHRAPCGKMRYPKTCCDECAGTLWDEKITRHFEKTLATREKAFAEKFNTKFAGRFVYIGGYKNCESIITCKCLICGHKETITAQCVRNKTTARDIVINCSNCKEKEHAEAEKAKAEEKKQEAEERKRIQAERIAEKENRLLAICPECGKEYRRTGKGKDGGLLGFCSIACRNKKRNRLKELRRRRIYKNGVVDHSINLYWLMRRDKNKCQICGYKVDTNDYKTIGGVFIVGENYPSIDHIKPVSRGGAHTRDNVQLAHMKCNGMKGDKEVYEGKGCQMAMSL